MAIQLGADPEHNFTTPLGLLSDCHRRIEKFLYQLITIVSQVQEAERGSLGDASEADTALTAGQRKTLEGALRYFREAAPRHVLDAAAIRGIGEEMAARRGIDLPKVTDLNLYSPNRRPPLKGM